MEKERIVLTDCDGVLCLWVDGFDKFMAYKGYNAKPDTEHHYSMIDRYHITEDEESILINEYNQSSFIGNLPALRDSIEYVKRLAVDHDFKFICITSIGSHPTTVKYRVENLKNLFGDIFTDIICLESGCGKETELIKWKDSGLYWIEDHPRNAEDGHNFGLKSILVRQEYNSHYETDKFPIVGTHEPWKEIYQLICEGYGLT